MTFAHKRTDFIGFRDKVGKEGALHPKKIRHLSLFAPISTGFWHQNLDYQPGKSHLNMCL